MRYLIYLLCVVFSYASVLSPQKLIEARGNVIDLGVYGNKLIAGSASGTLEVFDINDGSRLMEVQFDKIKDFMGDLIYPKVFSVDYDPKTNAYIAVVQAQSGARELVHVKDDIVTKLINKDENLYISKAKFLNNNRALLGLLSNEIILYDIAKKEQIYRFQVNFSHFSDLKVSEDRRFALNGCESGELSLIDVEKGKIIKVLKGGNVDNTYKVDIKNGYALGAGQDRRGIIYKISTGSFIRFDAPFLIYAGALSPQAKFAAFAFTQENDIVVFDLASQKKLHTLKGQKSTLNSIVFSSEKELFSGSDDKYIIKWRIP
jgi:WD40 repeat protein